MLLILVYAYGLLSTAAIAGAVMSTLFSVLVRAIVSAVIGSFYRPLDK